MNHRNWYRFFVLLVGLLVSGNAFAQDKVSVPPEFVQAMGSNEVTFSQIVAKLKQCDADNATCKETIDAVRPLLESCRPGCTPELAKLNGCQDLAFAKNPAGKAFAKSGGTAKVRVTSCLPPAVAKNGVCYCPDGTLDEDLGKSANGDEVTAKTTGKNEGACVPTFEATKRHVVRINKKAKLICRIDSYQLTQEEKDWLKAEGVDPDTQMDPTDELCENTSKHLVYMLTKIRKLEANTKLSSDDRSMYLDTPNTREELEKAAQLEKGVQDLKNRVGVLERSGFHAQLIASPFYTFRPEQDTYGILLQPALIKMDGKNGFMLRGSIGYGKQPYSQSFMLGGSISWYRLLNETTEDSKTQYAFYLGAGASSGLLLKNVADESQVCALVGGQAVYKRFVADLNFCGGLGYTGMYHGNSTRLGYTALQTVGSIQLGLGFFLY